MKTIRTKHLLAIAVGVIILYLMLPGNEEIDYHEFTEGTLCDEESRSAEACIEIYQPVCGWFDSSRIQCIKYPCAETFSNSCFACQNPDVSYWTEGECPKG